MKGLMVNSLIRQTSPLNNSHAVHQSFKILHQVEQSEEKGERERRTLVIAGIYIWLKYTNIKHKDTKK